jgi:OCRE domain
VPIPFRILHAILWPGFDVALEKISGPSSGIVKDEMRKEDTEEGEVFDEFGRLVIPHRGRTGQYSNDQTSSVHSRNKVDSATNSRRPRSYSGENSTSSGSSSDGRWRKGKSTMDRQGKRSKKQKREWPPCFETDGSMYVLDPRCGMFYEHTSDFFYDPKSKLYFGTRQQTYYQYDATQNPPFVSTSESAEGASSSATVQKPECPPQASAGYGSISQDVIPSADERRGHSSTTASIAIRIKSQPSTKKSKTPASLQASKSSNPVDLLSPGGPRASSADTSGVGPVTGSVRLQKDVENISKWTARQAELGSSGPASSAGLVPATTVPQSFSSNEVSSAAFPEETSISYTKDGNPICRLCQRKFPSVDKLRHHERASELHKSNLAKQRDHQRDALSSAPELQANGSSGPTDKLFIPASAVTEPVVPPPPVYVDRAKQRRLQHGVDVLVLPEINEASGSDMGHSSHEGTEASTSSIEPLGANNIGNQMLRKLGWIDDGVLGRNQSETESASPNDLGTATAAARSKSAHQVQHESLKKDWDRIESIAMQSSQSRSYKTRSPCGYSPKII